MNISIKESVLSIKTINSLLIMVKICLGVVKNCPFIGRRIKYFQVKFCKYYLIVTVLMYLMMNFRFECRICLSCKNKVNRRGWIFYDVSGFFEYLRDSKLRSKKVNFAHFNVCLSPSDLLFDLALTSPMTVVRKGFLLKESFRFIPKFVRKSWNSS